MDARLIENATDLDNLTFKDRGIYMLTPKGLHVLERFITKNGISAEHLLKVFATQSICLKLLHLERRTSDDEILIGKAVIEIIFKRFLGRQPNLPRNEDERSGGLLSVGSRDDRSRGVAGSGHHPDDPDRNLGIIVKKVSVVEREKSPTSSPGTSSSSPEAEKDKVTFSHDYIFLASAGMDWLCDFTTIVGRDEAAEMCAHFVRYGLIKMVPDTKSRPIDPSKVVVVRTASAPTGTQPVSQGCEIIRLVCSNLRCLFSRARQSFASRRRPTTKSHPRDAGGRNGPKHRLGHLCLPRQHHSPARLLHPSLIGRQRMYRRRRVIRHAASRPRPMT